MRSAESVLIQTEPLIPITNHGLRNIFYPCGYCRTRGFPSCAWRGIYMWYDLLVAFFYIIRPLIRSALRMSLIEVSQPLNNSSFRVLLLLPPHKRERSEGALSMKLIDELRLPYNSKT